MPWKQETSKLKILKCYTEMWNFHARAESRLRRKTPELRPKPGSRVRVKKFNMQVRITSKMNVLNMLKSDAKCGISTPELRRDDVEIRQNCVKNQGPGLQ